MGPTQPNFVINYGGSKKVLRRYDIEYIWYDNATFFVPKLLVKQVPLSKLIKTNLNKVPIGYK